MTAQRVKIQNLLRDWRCERRLNPCYEDAKIACHEWTRSFNCFDARSQRAFDLCDFRKYRYVLQRFPSRKLIRVATTARLAMLMYPHFDERKLLPVLRARAISNPILARSRTGCNLMALFFVFDHLTDVEDEKVARQMADITMDALRNPDKPRPAGECALGEMARQ